MTSLIFFQYFDNTLLQTLEEVRLDRAGVKRREYKNSMYKIKNSYKWYVVAEGATPLLTFKEALSHHPAIELMQREIVLKFYKTLTDLIYKNEATRGLCELIFYDGNLFSLGFNLFSNFNFLFQILQTQI